MDVCGGEEVVPSWRAGSAESTCGSARGQAVLAPAPFSPVGQPRERLEQADECVAFDKSSDISSPRWATLESYHFLIFFIHSSIFHSTVLGYMGLLCVCAVERD